MWLLTRGLKSSHAAQVMVVSFPPKHMIREWNDKTEATVTSITKSGSDRIRVQPGKRKYTAVQIGKVYYKESINHNTELGQ